MTMRYEAILFDLDGVVVDTQRAVTAFWQQVAAHHGRELTPADLDQWVYGCPANTTLDALFAQLSKQQRAAVLLALQAAEQTATYQEIAGVVKLVRTLHRGTTFRLAQREAHSQQMQEYFLLLDSTIS